MDANDASIHNLTLNADFSAVESRLHADPHLATSKDIDQRTPLHWVCVSGSDEIFRCLLSLPSKGEINRSELERLDLSTGFGNYHIDINAIDDAGWTPLMIAISAGFEDIYMTLLSISSIDISRLNRGGQSVLHFACSKQRIPAVETILSTSEGKKMLRIKDLQGQLPLHRAAACGSLPIVEMLITAGTQLSVSDAGGWTALHHACSEGHGDIAVRLIMEGIDCDKPDRDGEVAIRLCPADGKCSKFIRSSCPEVF